MGLGRYGINIWIYTTFSRKYSKFSICAGQTKVSKIFIFYPEHNMFYDSAKLLEPGHGFGVRLKLIR